MRNIIKAAPILVHNFPNCPFKLAQIIHIICVHIHTSVYTLIDYIPFTRVFAPYLHRNFDPRKSTNRKNYEHKADSCVCDSDYIYVLIVCSDCGVYGVRFCVWFWRRRRGGGDYDRRQIGRYIYYIVKRSKMRNTERFTSEPYVQFSIYSAYISLYIHMCTINVLHCYTAVYDKYPTVFVKCL